MAQLRATVLATLQLQVMTATATVKIQERCDSVNVNSYSTVHRKTALPTGRDNGDVAKKYDNNTIFYRNRG